MALPPGTGHPLPFAAYEPTGPRVLGMTDAVVEQLGHCHAVLFLVDAGFTGFSESGGEGRVFIEQLAVLEAVVELAEHAVDEVALGGVPGSVVVTASPVMGLGAGEAVMEAKAHSWPAGLSRSFFTHLRVMLDFLLEALVMGEAPA